MVEFSSGLGGLSGIAAVFIQRTGDWLPVDRWRVLNLLMITLTPAFAALFAMGISRIVSDDESAWRFAAGFLLFALCIMTYVIPAGRRKLPANQEDIAGPGIFAIMSGSLLVVLTFQVAAIFGAFGSHACVVFFYGLIAMLLLGVVQFVRIILVRPKQMP